jgi:hypothetical protein
VALLSSWESVPLLSCPPISVLGICKALFGRDVLISTYPFPVIDPILFALPLSVLAIIGVSMMTYKK